jgi:hypothetical protein
MKFNFQGIAYLAFAALIGFTSCKKDEEVPAPTLTFNLDGAQSGSFNTGETVDFDMNLESENDYTSLKGTLVYTKNDNSSSTVTIKDANKGNAEMNYTKNSDIEDAYDGISVVRVALPADAKKATEWTITVEGATSGGKTTATFKGKIVNTWSAKLLGAQTNAAGSYFNSLAGSVLQGSAASATPAGVDITYAALGAPTAFPTILSYKQRTAEGLSGVPAGAEESYFVETTLQPSNFLSESISWKSLFNGTNISTSTPQKIQIATSKVYAFKNKAGKMGLIHISSITGGVDGSVTIDVKAEN